MNLILEETLDPSPFDYQFLNTVSAPESIH